MKSVIAMSAVLASASAFVPSTPFTGSRVAAPARTATTSLSMAAADLVGASAPLGFFDPLGFSKGSEEQLNAYRESELKHGRTAMLAVVGFLTQENFHPLYNGGLSSNPCKAIFEMPPEGFFQIIMFCGFLEYIISQIKLQPGYVPGDYLGVNQMFSNTQSSEATQKINSNGDLVPIDEPDAFESDPMELWRVYQTKELHNGRAAMMGITGLVTHNLLTGGMPAFEQIARGVYSGGIH